MKKLVISALTLVLWGCSATPSSQPGGENSPGDGDGSGDGDAPGDGDGSGDGDHSGDGDGDSDKGEPLPDGTESGAVLPSRIRRLTNAEYDASVAVLLGTEQAPGLDFPPDARQHGFTVNVAQRVDPVLARKLDSAAIALADEAIGKLNQLAPCSDPQAASQSCAESFISDFGRRAYRRPLTEEETAGLLALYETGAEGASYADGIHLVIRGILQSPGFLYVTEIGEDEVDDRIVMTDYEIASSLSYLFGGQPPDEELMARAEAGELRDAEERRKQATRLLGLAHGKSRAVDLVRQWLGVDRITSTAKDSTVYGAYAGLRDAMAKESIEFPLATLDSSRGSLDELLGATWTIADGGLAQMYGASGQGRIDVPDRPGLLNQAAFLSVFAHAHESAPVLRGTAVLRRLGCIDIEIPTTLDVEIVPPVPDPTLTTRERFAIHSKDAGCANCHRLIDPIGFSFEQFDGMGQFRTIENGRPIDSGGDVAIGKDFDGSYSSSSEFSLSLARSQDVAECFARQMFRASAGEESGIEKSEAAFLDAWGKLEEDDQRSLLSILIALAGTDLMIYRSEP